MMKCHSLINELAGGKKMNEKELSPFQHELWKNLLFDGSIGEMKTERQT